MPHPATPLDAVHPQSLLAELRTGAKVDPQKLADHRRETIGRDVERALALAGITKQDAAFRMGYSDAGTVSRWCSGMERPHFDKLAGIDGFDEAWMKARAERNPRMTLRTVIEMTA